MVVDTYQRMPRNHHQAMLYGAPVLYGTLIAEEIISLTEFLLFRPREAFNGKLHGGEHYQTCR